MAKRLGLEIGHEATIEDLIKYMKLAEERGFESAWIPEGYYYQDAITRMALLSSITSKIKLATGIINPYTRSPPLIAMTFATLDKMSNNRTIFGLGPSLRLWLYETHRGPAKHVVAIKECIDIFRDLIAGKTVNYDGDVFKVQNVRLGFKPGRDHIPVYLGVMGPRMLQLAGEIADGVLLTNGATPDYVKFALENVKIGAERRGRDYREIDLASLVILSVSEDSEGAKEVTRELVAYLVGLPAFDQILVESGLKDYEAVTPIRKAVKAGDIREAALYVNDELVEALTVSGNPKECRHKLEKFTAAGVNLPVITPCGDLEMAIKEIY